MHGRRKALDGTGQLVLRNGRMDQYPMLQLIGQALQIDELTSLELQQAQLDLQVKEDDVLVSSLVLESQNVSLTAHGTTGIDGKNLDLASALTISAKIARQLPDWVRQHFQSVEGSDRQSIRFHVGGSLGRPDADLMRVIVGEKIEKQALDLFQRLSGGAGWHKKKSEKNEKKKSEKKAQESEPAATPAATAPAITPAPASVSGSGATPAPAASGSATLTPQP